MLKLTPIDTSMEDVIEVIDGNAKWRIKAVYENGYSLVGEIPVLVDLPNKSSTDTIGVKSIHVFVGEYNTILDTSVEVYYAFGEDLKLIDIAVKKDTDGL